MIQNLNTILKEIRSDEGIGQDPEIIKFGLEDLDKMSGGLRKGTLNLFCARPGMGKSFFGYEILKYVSWQEGKTTLLFTRNHNINYVTSWFKDFMLFFDQIFREKGKIFINDSENAGLFNMLEEAAGIPDLELIVIDDYQSILNEKEITQEKLAEKIQFLKIFAKARNLAVLILYTQEKITREITGEFVPSLDDIELGGNDSEFNKIFILHRPEYYAMETDGNGHDAKNLAIIITAKNPEARLRDTYITFEKGTFSTYYHKA